MFKRSVGKLLLVVGVVITLALSTVSFAQAGTIFGVIYDDTSTRWSYSAGWWAETREGPILNTQHVSGTTGSTATFNSCTPTSVGPNGEYGVTLYHSRAYNRGIAQIELWQNGNLKASRSVDQYGPGVIRQQGAEVVGLFICPLTSLFSFVLWLMGRRMQHRKVFLLTSTQLNVVLDVLHKYLMIHDDVDYIDGNILARLWPISIA
jgi:hypothetical protein